MITLSTSVFSKSNVKLTLTPEENRFLLHEIAATWFQIRLTFWIEVCMIIPDFGLLTMGQNKFTGLGLLYLKPDIYLIDFF